MQCGCVGLRVALRVCRRVVLFPSHSPVSTLRPRFAVLPGVSHTTAGECAWGALCSSDAGVDGGEHSPGLEVENGARVRVARVSDRAEGRWRDQCRPSVRSPPPHLYTQSVSARGVNAVVSVVLVASSLEH